MEPDGQSNEQIKGFQAVPNLHSFRVIRLKGTSPVIKQIITKHRVPRLGTRHERQYITRKSHFFESPKVTFYIHSKLQVLRQL